MVIQGLYVWRLSLGIMLKFVASSVSGSLFTRQLISLKSEIQKTEKGSRKVAVWCIDSDLWEESHKPDEN